MTPPMADMDKTCMGYALCPDALTDEKKAMASVNGKMMVKSSHDAILVPLWLDPAPNGVGVTGGMDNMPFANVDWKAMQSEVVGMGVTFKATRVSIGVGGGAGQETVPESEVMHITCGPFHCSDASMEKPMAPEITIDDSAVCAAWDPDLELQVGRIDNDFTGVVGRTGPFDVALYNDDDGVDIGWVSSSHVAMSVKHKFAGIENGRIYSVSGTDASKGSNKPLAMEKKDNADWGPGFRFMKAPGGDAVLKKAAKLDELCEGTGYQAASGGVHKPDGCFRIAMGGTKEEGGQFKLANYLSGYSVEVSAKDSSVSWGKVKWKEDPFKDLKCAPMTFAASDQVDICELFEAEVDQALAKGWGDVVLKTDKTSGTDTSASGTTNGGVKLRNWEVKAKSATPARFKRLFFDDNLNGKISSTDTGPHYWDTSPANETGLSDLYHWEGDNIGDTAKLAIRGDVGLTNDAFFTDLRDFIWMTLMDPDGDPTMGDFGKVDLYGKDSDASASGNDKKLPDGKADNYPSPDDAEMCTNDDNDADDEICDAKWEMDYEVKFGIGTFAGCEATRTVTISCEWDAQGLLPANPDDTPNGNLAETDNLANFAKCTAK